MENKDKIVAAIMDALKDFIIALHEYDPAIRTYGDVGKARQRAYDRAHDELRTILLGLIP